jgi:uncharacterized membrane protein
MIEYILTIILILLIDFIWLILNSKNYNYLVEKVQKTPLSINYIGAILSYIVFICGLFFFSIPLIEIKLKENNNLFILCLLYGGGLGLLLYGMFNATNYGIFTNYNYKIALMDSFWGFTIFTISSYLFFSIKHIIYVKSK